MCGFQYHMSIFLYEHCGSFWRMRVIFGENDTTPWPKDKLQDQKFIIYKAIRYLMSDISMQYHNRDEFSLLWSAFQTLYRQVFYLAVSICPKTGFRRNLWHNPSTCLWRGNKQYSSNLMNMVCFTSCRLAFDNLINRLKLHILHTHDTIKVHDTGRLVNWVKNFQRSIIFFSVEYN